MKKLCNVLLFLCILAFSCSKDSPLNFDQDASQLLSNTAPNTYVAVIKVYPGPNDTQALIDAFARAKSIGKYAVVKLMSGTFRIGMIEVREFSGTLTGSGKGKTIITSLPGLTPDAVIALNKVPALITFIGGDVTVSNLSVVLSEGLSWIGQYEMDMLLFSDYSADFMPAKKHIDVNLNNIEVVSIQQFNYPNNSFNGAKFTPDVLQKVGNVRILRGNIDAKVTNSKFAKLSTGILVWGCKMGNFKFGPDGGNIFIENSWGGIHVQCNIGVTVKIMNNIFNIPDHSWGLDLNSFDDGGYEYPSSMVGTFDIRDNIFNIHSNSLGFGLWDHWRFDHPENPDWMRMTWDHNTFNALADGAAMGNMFGIKDAVYSKNKIIGDVQGGYLGIYGSWLGGGDQYWLEWTENCKFMNNHFLQKNFVIYLNPTTKDCLIMGDLTNVTVNDEGVNNKVIAITH